MLNLEDRFERAHLGFFPSPLQPLERLSAELGVEVWAKRDDVSSGLAYGGNKVRKLEWLLPDALAKGCDTLVSIGGVQSNHTRQVAASSRRPRGSNAASSRRNGRRGAMRSTTRWATSCSRA